MSEFVKTNFDQYTPEAKRELLLSWVKAIDETGVNVNAWERRFVDSVRASLTKGWELTPSQETVLESIYSERTP